MHPKKSKRLNPSQSPQDALSRWDNEGGAQGVMPTDVLRLAAHELSDTELAHLRVRVIALENVLIALLAHASESQFELIHEMADYISPRPGFTQHPLTTLAAKQMVQLVDRAGHFRSVPPE